MVQSKAYSPLDGLLDLACRDGVDIRPTLLRVLTDLYVQKPTHTVDEETQYIELAIGLIGSVDAATRAVIAARLGAYPGAPDAVLRKLRPASTNLERHPEVIAPKLSSVTLRCSAEGPASKGDGLGLSSFEACSLRSLAPQDDGNPLIPAGAATATKRDLTELFFSAPAEERRLILTNFASPAEHHVNMPTPPTTDIIRRLENAALQRNAAEFGRILEWGVGISRDVAERIAYDSSGEAIVVVAKGIGMKADVLQRILLFLNPVIGHSVRRVFDLAQLYDDIAPAAAAHMLTIWREAGMRLRPAHVPQYVDDRPANARTVTAHTQYSRPLPRATQASPNQPPQTSNKLRGSI